MPQGFNKRWRNFTPSDATSSEKRTLLFDGVESNKQVTRSFFHYNALFRCWLTETVSWLAASCVLSIVALLWRNNGPNCVIAHVIRACPAHYNARTIMQIFPTGDVTPCDRLTHTRFALQRAHSELGGQSSNADRCAWLWSQVVTCNDHRIHLTKQQLPFRIGGPAWVTGVAARGKLRPRAISECKQLCGGR